MHFGPHKTWICFCFQVHWCKLYPFPKILPPPGGWLIDIKMDILRRGEYSRKIRKARQGGREKSIVPGDPHWAAPSHNGRWSGLVSLWGLAQMLLSVSDADGNLCRSNQLLQVVLTMHRVIISSAELLQKVITLYPFSRPTGSLKWECSRGAGNRKCDWFGIILHGKWVHMSYILSGA